MESLKNPKALQGIFLAIGLLYQLNIWCSRYWTDGTCFYIC